MIVKVFIKEKATGSEDIRQLQRVLEIIEHEGYRVDRIDPDSALGQGVAEAYDVIAPAVLVVRENGAEVMGWRENLPKNAGDLRYFLGHQTSKLAPSKISKMIK